MKKNDIFETEIMDMTTEGSGVCRVDNMAVFVFLPKLRTLFYKFLC